MRRRIQRRATVARSNCVTKLETYTRFFQPVRWSETWSGFEIARSRSLKLMSTGDTLTSDILNRGITGN
jgi:hypothetical protein